MQLEVTYDPLGTPDGPHLVYEGASLDAMRDAMAEWISNWGEPEDRQRRMLRWFDNYGRKGALKGYEPEMWDTWTDLPQEKWKIRQVVGS